MAEGKKCDSLKITDLEKKKDALRQKQIQNCMVDPATNTPHQSKEYCACLVDKLMPMMQEFSKSTNKNNAEQQKQFLNMTSYCSSLGKR